MPVLDGRRSEVGFVGQYQHDTPGGSPKPDGRLCRAGLCGVLDLFSGCRLTCVLPEWTRSRASTRYKTNRAEAAFAQARRMPFGLDVIGGVPQALRYR